MSDTAEATVPPDPAARRRRPTRAERGVRIVAAADRAELLWYLLADRYTPYTQQARVQALIVPVAAEVSRPGHARCDVHNNQTVEAGQDLFEIDPEPFQIAVDRARADLEATRRQVGASTAGIDSALASLRAAAGQRTAEPGRTATDSNVCITTTPARSRCAAWKSPAPPSSRPSPRLRPREAEVQRAREQEGGSNEDNAQLRSATTTLAESRTGPRQHARFARVRPGW